MRASHKSGHLFCWALVMLFPLLFLHLTHCQPQNYFKGNSMTQLPSKALPRIGRRSGAGAGNGEIIDASYPTPGGENSEYFNKERAGGDPTRLYAMEPEGLPYPLTFQGHGPDHANANSYALYLFKRLREDAFRPEEPTGIYGVKND